MTTLQNLTLRRNAALSRLTALQRRAERVSAPGAGVIGSALNELTAALEEVQVATEQLEQQIEELATAKIEARTGRDQMNELIEVLPVACVWTTADGEIDRANGAAAEMLNVSAARLAGRPLMLFTTERRAFSDALAALTEGVTRVVEVTAVIRPRERRPREVRLIGRKLQHDTRYCWFLSLVAAVPEPSLVPEGTPAHTE